MCAVGVMRETTAITCLLLGMTTIWLGIVVGVIEATYAGIFLSVLGIALKE